MRGNGRKTKHKRFKLLRSALHRGMAVALGVFLLASQLDLATYAVEDSVVLEEDDTENPPAVTQPEDGGETDGEGEDTSSENTEEKQPGTDDNGGEENEQNPDVDDSPEEGNEDGDTSDIEEEGVETGNENTDEEAGEIQDAVTVEEENVELTSEQAETVTLAESAEPIAEDVVAGDYFVEDDLIYYVKEDLNSVAVSCHPSDASEERTVSIPSTVEHDGRVYEVTEIPEEGFFACFQLTEVEIPESIIAIGDRAFCGCENLKKITIPDKPITYGSGIFSNCKSLTSIDDIVGRSSMTEIPDGMFAVCSSLENVTIPSNIKSIGAGAFVSCYKLSEVSIPSSVTQIKSQAFAGCENLTEVSMEYGITVLDGGAFSRCFRLKQVDVPDSVEWIGNGAFEYCTGLEQVRLPSGLSQIEEYTFYGCRKLTELRIPEGVRYIGSMAFSCSGLTSVTLPASIGWIGYDVFSSCGELSELKIAVTVTESSEGKTVRPINVGSGAFDGYSGTEERKLIFLTADEKKLLTGSDLAAAIDAYYKGADQGSWVYGWNLPKVELYTFNASAGEHGRINPSGSVTVAGGDNQIFTMTPDEGYRIKSVIVDRSEVTWEEAVQVFADEDTVQTGKAGTYTFPNVQADHTIEVSFEKVGGGTTGEENPPKGDNDPENPGNDRPIGGTTGSDNPGGGNSGSTDSGNGSTANGDNAEASAVDVIVTVVDSSAQAAPAVMTETETSAAQNGGNRVTADNAAAPKGTQSKEPKTGDSPHLEIYATFAMIAGLTYMLLYFMEEGRGMTEREKDVFVAAFIRWAKKGGSFRKCCALVAIFCILAYYHSVGRCGKEKLYPVLH